MDRTGRIVLLLTGLLAVALFLLRLVSDGVREMGDGIQHYMMARFCWRHPELILDLWGKPLFTLLASPFAQFGYKGMAAFNALLAFTTARLADRGLRSAGTWTRILAPVLIIGAPWYALAVVDGMTEVLFGGVALAAVICMLEGRWTLGALLASLTPLCRPEYVVFLPCVIAWLIVQRRWLAIPWCFAGIAAYTIVGYIYSGDPLCWIHNEPYAGSSVYGTGDPIKFLSEAPVIMGWPLTVAFILALGLWYPIRRRNMRDQTALDLLFVTTAIPALGIPVVHAWLWWSGGHGSAGLGRVMVTSVPLMVLFSLYVLGRASQRWPWRPSTTTLAFSVMMIVTVLQTFTQVPLHQRSDPDLRMLQKAAARLREIHRPDRRLFVSHTFIPFLMDLDPFDTRQVFILRGVKEGFTKPDLPGDLVLWESQLGPNECGTPLALLLGDSAFTVRGVFVPEEGHLVIGNLPYECFIFERKPAVRTLLVDTMFSLTKAREDVPVRMDTIPCGLPEAWCGACEFPWSWEAVPHPDAGSIYDEWTVTCEVTYEEAAGENAKVVLTQAIGDRGVRYEQYDLSPGANTLRFRVHPIVDGVQQKLYVWSPQMRKLSVRRMQVVRSQCEQH